jgi:hypothetical protein
MAAQTVDPGSCAAHIDDHEPDMSPSTALPACTLAALAGPLLTLSPAHAQHGGDDVVRSGSCSGHADWKLKVKPDDGRIELEAEVDSNRTGQVWRWRITHNGSGSATGKGTTSGASGSFEVHRRMSNPAGADTYVLPAVHRSTGEICRGTVML